MSNEQNGQIERRYWYIVHIYKQHILITMINFAYAMLESNMWSRHGINCDFTALYPPCIAAPPIQVVLSEPYWH